MKVMTSVKKEVPKYHPNDSHNDLSILRDRRLNRNSLPRYHSYIYVSTFIVHTKLNLTSKLFTKTGFIRRNKRISFSTLRFDEIFML